MQTGNRAHRHSQNSSNSSNHIITNCVYCCLHVGSRWYFLLQLFSSWMPNCSGIKYKWEREREREGQELLTIKTPRGLPIKSLVDPSSVYNVSSNCQGTPKPGKSTLCLQLNMFDDCSWLELWKWGMKVACTTHIRKEIQLITARWGQVSNPQKSHVGRSSNPASFNQVAQDKRTSCQSPRAWPLEV